MRMAVHFSHVLEQDLDVLALGAGGGAHAIDVVGQERADQLDRGGLLADLLSDWLSQPRPLGNSCQVGQVGRVVVLGELSEVSATPLTSRAAAAHPHGRTRSPSSSAAEPIPNTGTSSEYGATGEAS